MKKSLYFVVVLLFLFTSSCGTLLKPYQIGKPHTSSLDVTVVVLDALGLLFIIIPGVIAFTVDHYNGTLYIPKGKISLNNNENIIEEALLKNGYEIQYQD